MGTLNRENGLIGLINTIKGMIKRQFWPETYIAGNIRNEFVTAENINTLFTKYKVPQHFDFLSIDIDGNDYWIWKAIDDTRFRPRVVCIEFNCHFAETQSYTIQYNPKHIYKQNKYYGASLLALKSLAESRNYKLVHVIGCLNAFFVSNDCLKEQNISLDIEDYFQYPVDVQNFYRSWNIQTMPTWFNSPAPFELEALNEQYSWVEV